MRIVQTRSIYRRHDKVIEKLTFAVGILENAEGKEVEDQLMETYYNRVPAFFSLKCFQNGSFPVAIKPRFLCDNGFIMEVTKDRYLHLRNDGVSNIPCLVGVNVGMKLQARRTYF